jgi:hypothetical protein
MTHDELIQQYYEQMREGIVETQPNAYTQGRVALIKEYIEKPSHEQYWLIMFERHWRDERDNS